MEENGTIKIKKDSFWKYATLVLVALIVVGGFVIFSGDDDSGVTGNAVNANQQGQAAQTLPTTSERVSLKVDEDAFMGEENAPVTVVEFTDYQCPFCGRHTAQTVPQIKSEYVDTGKVRYVLKDFPLESIHPQALPAAIAAECVRDQGGDEAYWEMHDKIFMDQGSISDSQLKAWAKEVGYDISSCLDSNEFQDEVRTDLQEGQASGITGTPGTLVLMDKSSADVQALIDMQEPNPRGGWFIRYIETDDGMVGVRISGAFPFSAFQKAIEAGL